MLHYDSKFILGNQTTRKTLTNAYTTDNSNDTKVLRIGAAVKVILDCEYTMGATETSNSIQVRVRFSNPVGPAETTAPATTEMYTKPVQASSTGTTTVYLQEYTFAAVSAAATYDRFQIIIPKEEIGGKYIDIALKETGVASNAGSASVKMTLVTEGFNKE